MNCSAVLTRCHLAVALAAVAALHASVALAVEPGLTGEVSYDHLKLPSTRFTFVFNASGQNFRAPNGVVSKVENHDGSLAGARLDMSWGTRTTFMGWLPMVAGIKGFFGRHDNAMESGCKASSSSAICAHMSLFDPDRNTQQIVISTGSLAYSTDMAATIWGLAVEGQVPAVRSTYGTINLRIGSGYRQVDTSLSMSGRRLNSNFPTPFTMSEKVRTGYVGGYVRSHWKNGTRCRFCNIPRR